MKANEIINILELDLEKYYNCVLIDGEWGIGKTYYVKKYLEKFDSKKVIYISLFGKKSIEDIKNDIYHQIIRNKLKKLGNNLKKGLKNVNIGVPGIGVSLPEIEININDIIKYKIKKEENIIFVFDDIERKNRNLPVEDLLGFIEWLRNLRKIKIIVIANETKLLNTNFDMDDDLKSKINSNIYNDFKEKVIDKTYQIKKSSDNVYYEMLNQKISVISKRNIEIELNQEVKNFFERHSINNLRCLVKALPFINKVLDNIDLQLITDEKLIRIILYLIAIVVEDSTKKYTKIALAEEKDKKDKKDIWYTTGTDFSSIITSKYFNGNIFMNNTYRLVSCLYKIYNNNEIKSNFEEIEKLNIHEEKTRMKKDLFYLSTKQIQAEYECYIENKVKKYDSSIMLKEWLKEIDDISVNMELYKIMRSNNKEQFYKIVDKYVNAMNIDTRDFDFTNFYRGLRLNSELCKDICAYADKKYKDKYYNLLYSKAFSDKSNENLRSLLYIFSNQTKDKDGETYIAKIKNNFYKDLKFINLKKDEIDENEWDRLHMIWESMSRSTLNDKREFANMINRVKRNSSKQNVIRYEFLTNYYKIEDNIK